jgi:DNA-binding transcriptional regulator GbsR (MarR family)
MTEQQALREQYVERMGLLWEGEGLPRIAGRVFGFLTLQAEPCTLDDLATALGVSKGSVSTDARRLESLGLIRRVSLPGDRRDYYAVVPDVPARMLAMKIEQFERFERALDPLLERVELPHSVQSRITESRRGHCRVVATLRGLLAELTHDSSTPSPAATLPSR